MSGSPIDCKAGDKGERVMLDIILLAVGCSTFVLAIAYACACDRL